MLNSSNTSTVLSTWNEAIKSKEMTFEEIFITFYLHVSLVIIFLALFHAIPIISKIEDVILEHLIFDPCKQMFALVCFILLTCSFAIWSAPKICTLILFALEILSFASDIEKISSGQKKMSKFARKNELLTYIALFVIMAHGKLTFLYMGIVTFTYLAIKVIIAI